MNEASKHEKEYDVLRREIDTRITTADNYIIVMLTATATILGFALEQTHYGICLVPLTIIIPTFLKEQGIYFSIYKMGTYMYVYLEGDVFNWEHRNYKHDQEYRRRSSVLNIFSIFNVLIVVCVLLSIYKCVTGTNDYVCVRVIGLVIIGLLVLWMVKQNALDSAATKKKLIEDWNAIKEEENAEKQASVVKQ